MEKPNDSIIVSELPPTGQNDGHPFLESLITRYSSQSPIEPHLEENSKLKPKATCSTFLEKWLSDSQAHNDGLYNNDILGVTESIPGFQNPNSFSSQDDEQAFSISCNGSTHTRDISAKENKTLAVMDDDLNETVVYSPNDSICDLHMRDTMYKENASSADTVRYSPSDDFPVGNTMYKEDANSVDTVPYSPNDSITDPNTGDIKSQGTNDKSDTMSDSLSFMTDLLDDRSLMKGMIVRPTCDIEESKKETDHDGLNDSLSVFLKDDYLTELSDEETFKDALMKNTTESHATNIKDTTLRQPTLNDYFLSHKESVKIGKETHVLPFTTFDTRKRKDKEPDSLTRCAKGRRV